MGDTPGDVKKLKPRVLLLDDNASILEPFRLALERRGVIVDCFTSGREAIDSFRNKPDCRYDLFIIDVILTALEDVEKKISGFDVVSEIRVICPEARVVMMTAAHGMIDETLAHEFKLLAVWEKPIDDFAGAVEKVLDMPEEVQEERRDGIVKRVKGKKRDDLVAIVKIGLAGNFVMLCLSVALNIFATYRSVRYTPIMYRTMQEIRQAQVAPVVGKRVPGQYRVSVPDVYSAYKRMANGRVRLTLEFEEGDASAVGQLAAQRNAPFYVTVVREK